MAILSKDGRWKVNDTVIPTPSKDTTISHTNVTTSDSGRTQDGKMHITWVRTDVTTIALKYSYLTGAEAQSLRNLLQGKTFTFTYYDNGVKTMNAYCGETSYTEHSYKLHASEGGIYKDFSANIIEL